MSRFEGKVVVVTGAAGGIGVGLVARFRQEGASVVGVDLPGTSIDADLSVEADVTSSDDVAGYVAAALERFGRLDVLVHNAGVEGVGELLTDYPEDVFDRVLAVNVKGPWLGIKHGAPHLPKGGAIVNIASVAGLGGVPRIGAYVASKHAVVGLTKTAALELAPAGVRVNALCPAPVATRMAEALEAALRPDDLEAARRRLLATIPLRRYGTPGDVAAAAAWLASDEASFVTGVAVPLDGGSTAF